MAYHLMNHPIVTDHHRFLLANLHGLPIQPAKAPSTTTLGVQLGVPPVIAELIRAIWKTPLRIQAHTVTGTYHPHADPEKDWLLHSPLFPKTRASLRENPSQGLGRVRVTLLNELLGGLGVVTLYRKQYNPVTREHEATSQVKGYAIARDNPDEMTLFYFTSSPNILRLGVLAGLEE